MFEITGDGVTYSSPPTSQNTPTTADIQKCNSHLLFAKAIVLLPRLRIAHDAKACARHIGQRWRVASLRVFRPLGLPRLSLPHEEDGAWRRVVRTWRRPRASHTIPFPHPQSSILSTFIIQTNQAVAPSSTRPPNSSPLSPKDGAL